MRIKVNNIAAELFSFNKILFSRNKVVFDKEAEKVFSSVLYYASCFLVGIPSSKNFFNCRGS